MWAPPCLRGGSEILARLVLDRVGLSRLLVAALGRIRPMLARSGLVRVHRMTAQLPRGGAVRTGRSVGALLVVHPHTAARLPCTARAMSRTTIAPITAITMLPMF